MRDKGWLPLITALSVLLLAAPAAQSAAITTAFEGCLNSAGECLEAPVKGFYTYDPSAADEFGNFSGGATSFFAQLKDGQTFTSDFFTLRIINDQIGSAACSDQEAPMDLYIFHGEPHGMFFNFVDCSGQMFNSTTTLANIPSLTRGVGGLKQFDIEFSGELGGFVIGSIRRVPEPATLALLGLGLMGLAFASRRKK